MASGLDHVHSAHRIVKGGFVDICCQCVGHVLGPEHSGDLDCVDSNLVLNLEFDDI